MTLQEKADLNLPLGIYFHIPFCTTSCDFCAFYQQAPRRHDLDRYLAGMEQELAGIRLDRMVETVFWGGGTPGIMPARNLYRLGKALCRKLPTPPGEWTVEMAPATVKADKIAVLREIGVTRISLGVQSFERELLKSLGRQHSPQQVFQAIDTIRAQGIENLNLDLIFSIPGQSLKMWRNDLAEAIAVDPVHISTYCLTFEEDTALSAKLAQGQISAQGEKEEAAFYETTWEVLGSAGYEQYEISNYARAGFACRHNLNTWHLYEWLGFGPSAASQYRRRRYTNVPSLNRWLEGLATGRPNYCDTVDLTPEILAADCLIFGLRMNRGVDLSNLTQRFPQVCFDFLTPLWGDLSSENLLRLSPTGRLQMTSRGRLVADRIAVVILEAFVSTTFLESSTKAAMRSC